ncbi:hypothetical protein CDD80_2357 [Ophiocordyceps camponoti-rufipedis]|uniref:AB hydrolase-1 domain-containing protein n=1 Tax=Ophiocordyceps camponoti-rufipedis TaxID=2004952 RepID=A0A2C5Z0W9_9HYPO|nr:hypothetical protein CDD80_2357 [Ophiocordyceps camponoti-rufipedis]
MATDDQTPSYLAIYTVPDLDALSASESYARLRTHRSDREAALIKTVNPHRQLLDLIFDKQADMPCKDPPFIVSIPYDHLPDPQPWFDAPTPQPKSWLRTRLFHDRESNTALAIHDFSSPPAPSDFSAPGSRIWSLLYIFGSAPRDLAVLAAEPRPPAWSDGKTTTTTPGDDASIVSYVSAADGLVIPYRLEGNPSPNAPVIAMSNSLLTSLEMWDPLVKLIRKHRPDLAILRYDFRGRHSIPASSPPVTIDLLASDLCSVLDALRIYRLHALIGVSLGGATALRFAQLHPNRLERLVGCDFNPVSTPSNAQAWRDRAATPLPALADQTVVRWLHPRNASITPWLLSIIKANDPASFRAASEALHEYDLRPAAPDCPVPALLVVGDADAKGAMHAAMADFAPKLGPRGATLRVIAEAGHVPMCEDPDAFWDAIGDFL